jgi:hypothetical protein
LEMHKPVFQPLSFTELPSRESLPSVGSLHSFARSKCG